MAPVAAVVFDWAGTLTPWADVDVLRCWTTTARVIDEARATELGEALHSAERRLMERSRAELSSARLEAVFELAGVECSPIALVEYFRFWEPHTFVDPAGLDVLAGLRTRGIKVGMLSNTTWPRDRHTEIFERDGVLPLVDAFVYSSDVPWVKPHPEAFRAVLAALGDVPAHRAVYVGDRLHEDIYGAKSSGMRAVHIPHSNIPADEHGSSTALPDATIDRLADLLPVIDRWNSAQQED